MWTFFFKDWPYLREAAKQIGYDNGAINRECSESSYLDEAERRVQRVADLEHTKLVEAFLAGLSNPDFETLCSGDEVEAVEIARRTPARPFVDAYLEAIFE